MKGDATKKFRLCRFKILPSKFIKTKTSNSRNYKIHFKISIQKKLGFKRLKPWYFKVMAKFKMKGKKTQ